MDAARSSDAAEPEGAVKPEGVDDAVKPGDTVTQGGAVPPGDTVERKAAVESADAAQAPPGGPPSAIRFDGVRFGYPGREVLRGVDLRVAAGECVALVGLNGCGKSTLLRLAAGLLRPSGGRVSLDGDDLARLSRRAAARRVALLHQASPPVPGMTVRQLVRQGRYATRGPLGMLREGDDAVCARALADAGVTEWADRPVDALSGGERQRVRLAMALAQDTRVLLLDEPITYLDLRHQLQVLQTVVRLRGERALTVVMVLHDLGHAARFAERLVALRGGRVVADGPPADVVTPRLLADVLGVVGRVGRDPVGGWPVCYPDRPLSAEDVAPR
ncbi:ABC transporter ATP-binding protein [Streptomyces sp. NPDC003077]|uniref:ABC transporter ATP-binding protein n=1 Tax=Streptomyces sp. NPDC003077 TaxID=3154443 RepID=UPI0033BE76C4